MNSLDRRAFLQSTALLTVGFSIYGCLPGNIEARDNSASVSALPDPSQIDAWLQILDNGSVQILTGKMELGQGLTTVMQQVAGEELNIQPDKIRIVLADTGRTPDEGYTAGSRGVEQGAMQVRRAAAAAREKLIEAASTHWNVPSHSVTMDEGKLWNKKTDQTLKLTEILEGKQITTQIPQDVRLKPKEEYQWVGKPVHHPDMNKIVRGEAIYVQDLTFPGMVHARIIRPPAYGATLEKWDKEVLNRPGVLEIVENGSFLGVIAKEEYQAILAWQELTKTTRWKSTQELPEVTSWSDFMAAESGMDSVARDSPSTDNVTFFHSASYSKPYIMHGSIGPSCAVAFFENGLMRIWSHTQGVYPLRSSISPLLNLPEDRIRITGVRGSGCYGHNGADDVAADAAILAKAYPNKHVRLQWMRADEHGWEPYGSAMRMDLYAQMNSESEIVQWKYGLWSDSHSTRPRGHAGNLVSAHYIKNPPQLNAGNRVGGGTRNAEPYYDIPDFSMEDRYVAGPLRVSALRSLGAFANIFAIESFVDELAVKTEQDPFEFRLKHLSDQRAIAVIKKLQEIIRPVTIEKGQGLGIAFSRYKNTASYCAAAAKLAVDFSSKQVRLLHMWAALEAGEAINPDGLKNQTEGGMIQAASWTLIEEVNFDRNGVRSKDWSSYPILRFNVIPETEVHIINRPELPPLGAGEAAQGPTSAAIANAVYRACGKRVRNLPIEPGLFS